MRILMTVAALAFAATSFAQMFDDITLKMMSPKWSTVMVGSQSNFRQAGTHVIRNYNEWQQAWPYVAGSNYRYGAPVPQMINWQTEQIVMISLGNMGMQGYGVYVEDIRRVSNYQFNINYVITRPSFQAGISYSSFNYGIGSSPYVAIRVPRSYGIPNFNSRYYNPPSYVVNYGCGCHSCRSSRGHGQVWMVGAGGVLIPYEPPGGQKNNGRSGGRRGNGNRGG